MATIGIGVLGLGFMGRTHIGAIQAAQRAGLRCRLAAVCDDDEARLTGQIAAAGNLKGPAETAIFDPRTVEGYRDPDALFADPDVHIVHVCTWTDTHVDLASRALAAGKHVVIEKPVALHPQSIRDLARIAEEAGRICMPAMCMRWWPGWRWLKERVDAGELGPVRSATFRRLGAVPNWTSFYGDEARSGGALFDLHIHDVDFLIWCFGVPEAVTSTGTTRHMTSLYRFREGPEHVVAEGGWALPPAAGFRMQYTVVFEGGLAEFDLGRTLPLTVHRAEGSTERGESPLVAPGTGYEGEVAAMVEAVARGSAAGLPTLADAEQVTRVLLAERQALERGGSVEVA